MTYLNTGPRYGEDWLAQGPTFRYVNPTNTRKIEENYARICTLPWLTLRQDPETVKIAYIAYMGIGKMQQPTTVHPTTKDCSGELPSACGRMFWDIPLNTNKN